MTMFGNGITPNEHKLALQFGVLDNFFDSGEVSGDGHVWSTAGIGHRLSGKDLAAELSRQPANLRLRGRRSQ